MYKKSLILIFITLSLVGCKDSDTDNTLDDSINSKSPSVLGPLSGELTPSTGRLHDDTSDEDGSATGGGSFGDESSLFILNRAINQLTFYFENASPEVFASLPINKNRGRYSREELLNLIKSAGNKANHAKGERVFRYNREIMFDYRVKDDGTKVIVPLQLFFNSHAAIPVNSSKFMEIQDYIEEIKLKLIHEAMHHFEIGLTEETDEEARAQAESLLLALERDYVICRNTENMAEFSTTYRSGNYSENIWLIHRPSLRGRFVDPNEQLSSTQFNYDYFTSQFQNSESNDITLLYIGNRYSSEFFADEFSRYGQFPSTLSYGGWGDAQSFGFHTIRNWESVTQSGTQVSFKASTEGNVLVDYKISEGSSHVDEINSYRALRLEEKIVFDKSSLNGEITVKKVFGPEVHSGQSTLSVEDIDQAPLDFLSEYADSRSFPIECDTTF